MQALIQRVTTAKVIVQGRTVGVIKQGLLVFLAVEKHDSEKNAARLLERILGYRVFNDEHGKMNLSVRDIGGELLLVSQFTLAADTKKGMRPSFSAAAAPKLGEELYNCFVACAKQGPCRIATGKFGAHMQVELSNDGPVTFLLRV